MKFLLAVLTVALALVLAGCGSSSSVATTTTGTATPSAESTTLQLAADPSGKLEFDPTRLEAPARKVTIVFTNDSSVTHDVAIVGNGVFVESKRVVNGEKTSVSATLEPGTYEFYCTVPGHQDAGMQGVLVVV